MTTKTYPRRTTSQGRAIVLFNQYEPTLKAAMTHGVHINNEIRHRLSRTHEYERLLGPDYHRKILALIEQTSSSTSQVS